MTSELDARWPRLYRRDIRLLLLLVALTLALLLPYLQVNLPKFREPGGAEYAYDEGTYLYYAWRIAAGHVPYRDFFDFKGVVSYLPTALVYLFTGPSYVAGRLTQFALIAGLTALAYVNVVFVNGSRWAGAMAALFVPLVAWPTWPNAYHDMWAQFYGFLAVCLALRSLRLGERSWFGVGVCAALCLWTTLAQGTALLVSLAGAGVMVWSARGDWRGGVRRAGWFGLGVATVSAAIAIYALATGSLTAMLEAVFVFPFTSYWTNNITHYAQDFTTFYERWLKTGSQLALGAYTIGRAAMVVPGLAVVAATITVGLWLKSLLGARQQNAAGASATSTSLERLLLVCALAAAATPVVLSKTRSDLCHIGFVAPGCALVVLAALGLAPSRPGGWRAALRWGRIVAGGGVAAVLLIAGWFQVRNATSGYVRQPLLNIERLTRAAFGVDSDAALLLPGDTTVHLPAGYFPGGYSYLLSQRHSAIAFCILEDDGKYFAEQWPKAADEIVARRPRLLKITKADLNKLTIYRPEIQHMYFGFDGRYMLDARRPGPDIPDGSTWSYQIDTKGQASEAGRATLRVTGARLNVVLHTAGGDAGPVLGTLDGDRVSILHGQRAYVGKLDARGTTITGEVYQTGTLNDPARHLSMKRLDAGAAGATSQTPGAAP